ncbi:uncharacterized protein LODBEIA_P18850 [Lodderomyces beijingensis]|uniref:Uncharacterized protein n=1 Tax=Lodderomyces beijingensis TaxID=1775926 RepID=A0ABP0ZHN4_9ASCO
MTPILTKDLFDSLSLKGYCSGKETLCEVPISMALYTPDESHRTKYQIRLYNDINKTLEHMENLTFENYKLAICSLEYQNIFLRFKLSPGEDMGRHVIYKALEYVLLAVKDEYIDRRELVRVVQQAVAPPESKVNEYFSNFNYFAGKIASSNKRNSLLEALALTYAIDVFLYPELWSKIQLLKSKNQQALLLQLIPPYFHRSLNDGGVESFEVFNDIAQEWCHEHYSPDEADSVVEEMIDGISLTQMTTAEVWKKLRLACGEYMKKKKEFQRHC